MRSHIANDAFAPDARLAEALDTIRLSQDNPDGHRRARAARPPDGIPREVWIGEEVVDRLCEDAHAQLLEKMRTARRGRLLIGRIDASVLTSMALPSGRAICRA